MLFESTSHTFEVEGSVFIISKVTSPQINLKGFGFQRYVGVQAGVEILTNVVVFRPVNLSGTVDVRPEGKALRPAVVEEERVRTAYVHGVHGHKGHVVAVVVHGRFGARKWVAQLVFHESGLGVSVAGIQQQVAVDAGH